MDLVTEPLHMEMNKRGRNIFGKHFITCVLFRKYFFLLIQEKNYFKQINTQKLKRKEDNIPVICYTKSNLSLIGSKQMQQLDLK